MPRSKVSSDVKQAIELANKIVTVQGSIFVRELLRETRKNKPAVRIGANREAVRSNLIAAIEAELLSLEDLRRWIGEIEGWGNQHVYLYRVPQKLAGNTMWKSPATVGKRCKAAGLAEEWGSMPEPSFPDELSLESVDYNEEQLQFRWFKRHYQWTRDSERDKETEQIEGDTYEFHAYRRKADRSVMRFVLFPKERKAALFVQIPLGTKHKEALATARREVSRILPWSDLREVNISRALMALDELDIRSEQGSVSSAGNLIRSRNAKFEVKGATVEFDAGSLGKEKSFNDVDVVRDVGLVLLGAEGLRGQSAKFRVQLRTGAGMNRTVVMSLSGFQKRVFLFSKMTATEVWDVLDHVMRYSR